MSIGMPENTKKPLSAAAGDRKSAGGWPKEVGAWQADTIKPAIFGRIPGFAGDRSFRRQNHAVHGFCECAPGGMDAKPGRPIIFTYSRRIYRGLCYGARVPKHARRLACSLGRPGRKS
jgi:hypothetical protein